MLVMRTTKRPAYPLGKLVGSEQPFRLDDLALAVYPLRLNGVEPRTLLRKKATHYPDSAPALFHFSVVPSEPPPHLFGDVPGSVVPDEQQNLLAKSKSFEPLAAPSEKSGRYTAHGPPAHEPQPRLVGFGRVESVAGDGLRLGIVFGDRPPEEAHRLALLGPTVQGGQGHPAPPAFVQEADGPPGIRSRDFHQSIAPSFFLVYSGSGEVIHRLARIHRTPRRRDNVAGGWSPRRPASR